MYNHSLVIKKLSYYPGEIKEDRKSGNISGGKKGPKRP